MGVGITELPAYAPANPLQKTPQTTPSDNAAPGTTPVTPVVQQPVVPSPAAYTVGKFFGALANGWQPTADENAAHQQLAATNIANARNFWGSLSAGAQGTTPQAALTPSNVLPSFELSGVASPQKQGAPATPRSAAPAAVQKQAANALPLGDAHRDAFMSHIQGLSRRDLIELMHVMPSIPHMAPHDQALYALNKMTTDEYNNAMQQAEKETDPAKKLLAQQLANTQLANRLNATTTSGAYAINSQAFNQNQ